MEINNVNTFLEYYTRIRQRTSKVIQCIPADKLEWTFREGKFTLGDIVRHIATIERYMYAENMLGKPSAYPGCGRELAEGLDATLTFYNKLHEESIEIFSNLSDEELQQKCITPGGIAIPKWKWLRAMVEHEIHHRAQLYTYLAMLAIPTPPIFGLTSEEVLKNSHP